MKRVLSTALLGSAITLGSLLGVSIARADITKDDVDANPSVSFSSKKKPAKVTIEVRLGQYFPNVDGEFGGAKKPFLDTFNNNNIRLMFGAAGEYLPLHINKFGSIGFGGLFGFYKATAKAKIANSPEVESGEETSFEEWNLAAYAVLRITALTNAKIPFVPYFKAGPAMGIWTTSNGSGMSKDISTNENGQTISQKGTGTTVGLFGAAGLVFQLDWLDPHASKSMSTEHGVVSTGIFIELSAYELSGMFQSKAMNLSSLNWTAGFAVQF